MHAVRVCQARPRDDGDRTPTGVPPPTECLVEWGDGSRSWVPSACLEHTTDDGKPPPIGPLLRSRPPRHRRAWKRVLGEDLAARLMLESLRAHRPSHVLDAVAAQCAPPVGAKLRYLCRVVREGAEDGAAPMLTDSSRRKVLVATHPDKWMFPHSKELAHWAFTNATRSESTSDAEAACRRGAPSTSRDAYVRRGDEMLGAAECALQ